MKILVVGLGPTSIGFLYRYKELSLKETLLNDNELVIIEKNNKPGGLSSSITIDEYSFDIGVHLFASHYEYFTKILEKYEKMGLMKRKIRKSLIFYDNKLIPYPFQSNIHLLDKYKALLMLDSMKKSSNIKFGDNINLKQWAIEKFGYEIYRSFFEPQNEKSWGIPLNNIGSYWLSNRIPKPDVEEIEKKINHGEKDGTQTNWGPNNEFFIPSTGRCGDFWSKLVENLSLDINYNTYCGFYVPDVIGVSCSIFHGNTCLNDHFDMVVSSAPLHEVILEIQSPKNLKNPFSNLDNHLRYNFLCNTIVVIKGDVPEKFKDVTWIYLPNNDYIFYRLSIVTNYSHDTSPPGTFLINLEASYNNSFLDNIKIIESNAKRILMDLELTFDLSNIIRIIIQNPYPLNYPIPTLERNTVLNDIIPYLESQNIYSRGRFGMYKYEVGNMDHCFMQGVELCDRLFNSGTEYTIHDPEFVNSGQMKLDDD